MSPKDSVVVKGILLAMSVHAPTSYMWQPIQQFNGYCGLTLVLLKRTADKVPYVPFQQSLCCHNTICWVNDTSSAHHHQCTVLPELADESTVSAIDSPDAQGAYSSTYIFKAISLQQKVMFNQMKTLR